MRGDLPVGTHNMICRQSRDRLALALRRYVAGRLNNDELDFIKVDRSDRGAVAVKQMAWGLYDDRKNHYAAGRYAIDRDSRRAVARWIVFLHSDQEYRWPNYSLAQIFNWPLNLMTFGWWERRKRRCRDEFKQAGDWAAWPFITTVDLTASASKPRYLAGPCRDDVS